MGVQFHLVNRDQDGSAHAPRCQAPAQALATRRKGAAYVEQAFRNTWSAASSPAVLRRPGVTTVDRTKRRLGHAHEQLDREALRDRPHELAPALHGDLVDQFTRQPPHIVLHLLHAGGREKRVDDAPQIGVQWWIALVGQRRRLARIGRVELRIAGKLVGLAQHVTRHIRPAHDPGPRSPVV